MPDKESHRVPWVEKYRPSKLDDLISHDDIVSTINRFIKANQLPHLLFYGPPGTGKTSTILACAKMLYSPSQFKSNVLELNASDDRGINIVREQVLSFASTRTIFSGTFKLIILDEADAMTSDAQNALRRIIEKYTENVRFCVICNYLSKIIPAVQSRCMRFRFAPLSPKQVLPRLNHIIEEEKVNVTEDGKEALITLSKGDMRKVINVLQSASMAFDVVNEDNVYTCVGHPLRSDIEGILQSLLSTESFEEAYDEIEKIKSIKGLALEDIITELHLFVMRLEVPMNVLNELVIKMANIEERLASGVSEDPQVTALISAFFLCRNMLRVEKQPSPKGNMKLRYFYDLMSQPSRALYIVLRMGGIQYEDNFVDLMKGAHLKPEYKNINRFQKVPCITHGQFQLSESVAILRYLSNKGLLAERFYPKQLEEQARVDEFLEWQHLTLRAHCALYFRHIWLAPLTSGKAPNADTVAKLTRNMERELNVMENIWLENNNFLMGGNLTAADIFAACEIEQTRLADYDVRINYPKIRAWLKRVRTTCNPHYDAAHKWVYRISGTAPNAKL